MNTKKSFPCASVLTEKDIEWLEFGFEEWVDALEQTDGGWESNALNQTSFFEIVKNETFSKKKYAVYSRLGENHTLVGVFDTEQEALQAVKEKNKNIENKLKFP